MTNTSSASAAARLANFTAALLAPLPEGIEAVDTRAFRRSMLDIETAQWRALMLKVSACKSYRDAAWSLRIRAQECFPETVADRIAIEEECQQGHWRACAEAMAMPAPTIGALRWKQERRGLYGGHADWDAAIAVDAARLGIAL